MMWKKAGSMVLVVLWIGVITAFGEVIYRENFGNPYPHDQMNPHYIKLGDRGWQAHYGATGTLAYDMSGGMGTRVPPGVYYTTYIPNINGRPTNQSNVNAGYSPSDSVGHVSFDVVYPKNGTDVIIWTDEYTVDTSSWNISEVSWYQAECYNDASHLAVRIGQNWYVSVQTWSVPGGNPIRFFDPDVSSKCTFVWTTEADKWRELNFVPGSSLVLGDVLDSELPQGDITAFGVFVEQERKVCAWTQIDTFTILGTPVPEPTSLVLLGLTSLFLWRRR